MSHQIILRATRTGTKLFALVAFVLAISESAHSDIFVPDFRELQSWNCPSYQDADCLLFTELDQIENTLTKLIKIRVETGSKKPYLRVVANSQILFFSDTLGETSPKLFEEVLRRCQFRAKNSYCAIKAEIRLGVVEKIEEWSLHRYDVVK